VWLEIYQGFEMDCYNDGLLHNLWAQEQWLRLVHILVPILHKISKSLKRFHRRQLQAAVKRETCVIDLDAMD